MDLFNNKIEQPIPLIKDDGKVTYYGCVINENKANAYYDHLLEHIEWENDQAIIYGDNSFGKKIITKRKVAWYGDKAFEYTYSNTTKHALPWIEKLKELKAIVEEETSETYNSCLLNLYHNGSEGMAWHSDGEIYLKKNAAIASLTFGAERKFSFKHKQNKESLSLTLKHGSLLVMAGTTQSNWLHRLPPVKNVDEPRINLTFRTIDER